MEAIELKNPKALSVPMVQNLFKRALESVNIAAPGGFDSVAEDIFRYVQHDGYFVVLGAENGEFKSLAMGFFPSDNIFPYPTVTLVFNEGSRGLLKATVRKMVDIVLERGYTKVWAFNASDHSTAAWKRLFLTPEGYANTIGEVVEFGVK